MILIQDWATLMKYHNMQMIKGKFVVTLGKQHVCKLKAMALETFSLFTTYGADNGFW